LLASLLVLTGFFATSSARADEIFSSDPGKASSIDNLDWKNKGANWVIWDYASSKSSLENSPGPVLKFGANGKDPGLLIKSFPELDNPSSMTLTFDAGWGWGKEDMGGDGFSIWFVDDDGNGYDIEARRTKATWAAQWGRVTNWVVQSGGLNWAPAPIDATQKAVIDGGGLQTFTITRDGNGKWTFSGAKWTGGTPFVFANSLTSKFTMVVLNGTPNIDDIVFGKIKLEADK